MAPAKNFATNAENKNKAVNDNAVQNGNNNNNNFGGGAKPKTASSTTTTKNTIAKKLTASTLGQQSSQSNSLTTSISNSPNSTTAMEEHHQQQQQQHKNAQLLQQQQQKHLRKNTEIVAPIRREFKDLNDYLLATVERTAENSNNSSSNSAVEQQQRRQSVLNRNSKQKLQNTSGGSSNNSNNFLKQQQLQQNLQQQTQQQHQPSATNFSQPIFNDNFEYDNFHENQRFCYPVRPIPRCTQQQQQQQAQQQQLQQNEHSTNISLGNFNANLLNHAATIGVVIPTTPNLATAATATSTATISSAATTRTQAIRAANEQQAEEQEEEEEEGAVGGEVPQRHQQYQQLLKICQKLVFGLDGFELENTTATTTAATNTEATNLRKKNKKAKMVQETNAQTPAAGIIVNSTSLEDVALSEASDNRAQSIQSLHSAVETPTPDSTPTYEELQHRLETSNRSIHNMQEQQQQLLRMQNSAKQHLTEMEQLRQLAGQLSFSTAPQRNGSATEVNAPHYESIENVHADMSNLVGRMRNLSTFIQSQNELSALLGDDGPELYAEEQALQEKLESLRTQRDEMRHLVDELNSVTRNAELAAAAATSTPQKSETAAAQGKQQKTAERVVPVEYARNVPIELLQAVAGSRRNDVAAAPQQQTQHEDPNAIAILLKQKNADIESMRTQLGRLKDMMQTINLIEEHTTRTDKDIGHATDARAMRAHSHSSSNERERTPVPMVMPAGVDANDAFIMRKMEMLNDVTADLRAQAESLQMERDRIQDLKAEIVRRKQQAAAAAQLGEDALKRNSLTPTPTTQRHQQQAEELRQQQQEEQQAKEERDQLKADYEEKKKQFAKLCRRLQNDTVSEADDEADAEGDETNDSDFVAPPQQESNYFSATTATGAANTTARVSNKVAAVSKQQTETNTNNTAAAPANKVAASHDAGTSFDAGGSIKSGSSGCHSLPPPMTAMNSFEHVHADAWKTAHCFAVDEPHQQTAASEYTHTDTMSERQTMAPATASSIHSVNSAAATASAAGGMTSAVNLATQLTTDPMLLQQFVQTQQLLISSLGQCNQMLWHQQREIDNLNSMVHGLQERVLVLSATQNPILDGTYNLRSESVPPPAMLPNNLNYGNVMAGGVTHRSQSEQPAAFPPAAPQSRRSAFTNYQTQLEIELMQQHQNAMQHLAQLRQRTAATAATSNSYNFSSESQQNAATSSAGSSSIYSNLNNAVPPPANQVPQPQFNNEAPQSPLATAAAGPAPIFMHHHNNSIYQNNANLRTQNHHANNLQQQQPPLLPTLSQQQQHNNAGNTLNNQVPPGNRANNYWDNFRSYSRQNLLSNNSNKSNEEQRSRINEQQQQQQQQQQHLHYQQQQNDLSILYDSNTTSRRFLERDNWLDAAAPAAVSSQLRYIDEDDGDYQHAIDMNAAGSMSAAPTTTFAPVSSRAYSNLRNMNVNFGNSPQYQRNKVPTKPTCRATAAATSKHAEQQQQQRQQQQSEEQLLKEQRMRLHNLDEILYAARNLPNFEAQRHHHQQQLQQQLQRQRQAVQIATANAQKLLHEPLTLATTQTPSNKHCSANNDFEYLLRTVNHRQPQQQQKQQQRKMPQQLSDSVAEPPVPLRKRSLNEQQQQHEATALLQLLSPNNELALSPCNNNNNNSKALNESALMQNLCGAHVENENPEDESDANCSIISHTNMNNCSMTARNRNSSNADPIYFNRASYSPIEFLKLSFNESDAEAAFESANSAASAVATSAQQQSQRATTSNGNGNGNSKSIIATTMPPLFTMPSEDDDANLAEADQTCSANLSNISIDAEPAGAAAAAADNRLSLSFNDLVFENNENLGEDLALMNALEEELKEARLQLFDAVDAAHNDADNHDDDDDNEVEQPAVSNRVADEVVHAEDLDFFDESLKSLSP